MVMRKDDEKKWFLVLLVEIMMLERNCNCGASNLRRGSGVYF